MDIDSNKYQEAELLEVVKKKVKKLKGFYIHAFIYALGVLFFILKEYYKVPFDFFPLKHINFFVMAIWSTAFLISAFDILISNLFFGKEWEEKKIKRIIEKEKNK